MKFAALFCLLACCQLHAQSPVERVATVDLTVDTVLEADHYFVSVIIAEQINIEWTSKKNIKRTFLPLDTMKQRFISQLRSLGFNQTLREEKITSVEEYSNGYGNTNSVKLFQLECNFVIYNRDSATQLFNKIDKEPLRSLKIVPQINKERKTIIRKTLDDLARMRLDSLVQALAIEQKIRIVKTAMGNTYYDGDGDGFNYWSGDSKFLLELKTASFFTRHYCTYTYLPL